MNTSPAPEPSRPLRTNGRAWQRLVLWSWVIITLAPLPWLMRTLPRDWWLPFSAWVGLTRLMWLHVVPDWLLSKLASRDPLTASPVTERLQAMTHGAAGPALYRLSPHTGPGKAEAYYLGFGRRQQILLSATLLDSCAVETVLAVVVHELGHWRRRDLWRQWAAFCLTALAISAASAYFGSERAWSPLTWGLATVISALAYVAYNRHLEFKADAWAVAQLGDVAAYARALQAISQCNGEKPDWPTGLTAWLHSHPSQSKRLKRLGFN